MQFNQDAVVLSWKGEKIGTVDRVVIDPETDQITDVVIKQGWLFTHDKVVPINLVVRATEDQVRLKISDEQLDQLPDFMEEEHILLEDEENIRSSKKRMARPVFWYPPAGGSVWVDTSRQLGFPYTYFVEDTKINIPDGTVAIKEGANVISRDDKKEGKVESFLTDPEGAHITHLMVSKGLINKEQKLIPSKWIGMVIDEEVHLSVDSNIVDRLPEYQPESS